MTTIQHKNNFLTIQEYANLPEHSELKWFDFQWRHTDRFSYIEFSLMSNFHVILSVDVQCNVWFATMRGNTPINILMYNQTRTVDAIKAFPYIITAILILISKRDKIELYLDTNDIYIGNIFNTLVGNALLSDVIKSEGFDITVEYGIITISLDKSI